jgi:putative tryptophan/tyrosine transport system substrate-binding protein
MTTQFTRRLCIAALGAVMTPRHVRAEQAPMPIIGLLDSSAPTTWKFSAFYEGLKVEGFSRNQNLAVEYHSAEGDYARLPKLAADLVNRRVSLITALGRPAALAAKDATASIPIVFAVDSNPIEIGLVASLSHPRANIAGVAGMSVAREQKRLELLRAAVPAASVFGFLINPDNSIQDAQIKDAVASAQKFGVQIKLVRARAGPEFSNAFVELTQSQAGGLVIADDEFFLGASAELGSLAVRHSMPTAFQGSAFAMAGGLVGYGSRLLELYHQAGTYSGLVLTGAAPSDLPIYQSTGTETIVNLRTARSLGINLPQAIIDQANTVIR